MTGRLLPGAMPVSLNGCGGQLRGRTRHLSRLAYRPEAACLSALQCSDECRDYATWNGGALLAKFWGMTKVYGEQTVDDWLSNLGLDKYVAAFVENDVDLRALPHVTEADLQELGVSLGHRKIILAAIKELQPT